MPPILIPRSPDGCSLLRTICRPNLQLVETGRGPLLPSRRQVSCWENFTTSGGCVVLIQSTESFFFWPKYSNSSATGFECALTRPVGTECGRRWRPVWSSRTESPPTLAGDYNPPAKDLIFLTRYHDDKRYILLKTYIDIHAGLLEAEKMLVCWSEVEDNCAVHIICWDPNLTTLSLSARGADDGCMVQLGAHQLHQVHQVHHNVHQHVHHRRPLKLQIFLITAPAQWPNTFDVPKITPKLLLLLSKEYRAQPSHYSQYQFDISGHCRQAWAHIWQFCGQQNLRIFASMQNINADILHPITVLLGENMLVVWMMIAWMICIGSNLTYQNVQLCLQI